MTKSSKNILFIPTYNVGDRAITVLENIPQSALERTYRVFIIDNGSTDGTRALLQNWVEKRGDERFRLFFNEENYSLGGSTIIAFREAILEGADFLVCLHSDGQADPHALEQFFDHASENVDFVLGNRLADRALAREYSLIRWWGNLFFERLQRVVARRKLGDIGAYIGFNLDTVKRLRYWSLPHDMAYQPLLILSAAREFDIRIVEFPIRWGKADRSTVNPFRYGIVHLFRLLSMFFGRKPQTARSLDDFKSREVVLVGTAAQSSR